ncbi:MAG: hypothetical protein HQ472_04600 [Ignavibacteria bacterium]|nr:hypothetical protein [Ignavibacteria bacterium]
MIRVKISVRASSFLVGLCLVALPYACTDEYAYKGTAGKSTQTQLDTGLGMQHDTGRRNGVAAANADTVMDSGNQHEGMETTKSAIRTAAPTRVSAPAMGVGMGMGGFDEEPTYHKKVKPAPEPVAPKATEKK